MKRNFWNILICLLLVAALAPQAMAATLDTTDLTINGNTITIGDGQNEILEALHAQKKTAKLAVPYSGSRNVYVLKDNEQIVAHNFEKEGYIQFETPGAGVYVILEGTPATLEQQLGAATQNVKVVLLADDILEEDHNVVPGTVIHANGHSIKGQDESKSLYSDGDLTIEDINGLVEILLGAKDEITFDTKGNITIEPDLDEAVGYGSVQITALDEDGAPVTYTYFLTEGERLKISTSGVISGNETFDAAAEGAEHPVYRVTYVSHDNTHVKGSSGKITAECNGLYDYYTLITLTPKSSSTAVKLVEKEDGEDVASVSGVEISEGSTVLTMKSSYLNELSVGEYTLTFHYKDGGSAEGKLLIKEKSSKSDETNPKTGDIILMPVLAMTISAAALAAMLREKKKRA